MIIIITMYIYRALINALSVHIKHINLNMTLYTHVKHSPTNKQIKTNQTSRNIIIGTQIYKIASM